MRSKRLCDREPFAAPHRIKSAAPQRRLRNASLPLSFLLLLSLPLFPGSLHANEPSSDSFRKRAVSTKSESGGRLTTGYEPGRLRLLLLDGLIPGYGSFYFNKKIAGSMVVLGRTGTLLLAARFYEEAREYRSAQKAAELADLHYGPGYRYLNPYGGGYLSAEEFRIRADRKTHYMNMSLLIHAGITLTGLLITDRSFRARKDREAPRFDLEGGSPLSATPSAYPAYGDPPPSRKGTRFAQPETGVTLRVRLFSF